MVYLLSMLLTSAECSLGYFRDPIGVTFDAVRFGHGTRRVMCVWWSGLVAWSGILIGLGIGDAELHLCKSNKADKTRYMLKHVHLFIIVCGSLCKYIIAILIINLFLLT